MSQQPVRIHARNNTSFPEVSRFPLSLDEAAGISLDITDEMKKATETELSVLFTSPAAASISETLQKNTTPGDSRRTSTCLSKELSQQIITASKRRGLKIITAVQAALVLRARRHMASADGSLVCTIQAGHAALVWASTRTTVLSPDSCAPTTNRIYSHCLDS